MKNLFQITAPGNDRSGQQKLALKIGEKHCSFAITDITGDKLFQLAYYTSGEITETFFIDLFSNHPELNNSFAKTVIGYDSPQSVFMPSAYFKSEDASIVLKAMHGISGELMVNSEFLAEWQLYNVYAVSKEIKECLNRKYPLADCFHTHSVGIKNIADTGNSGKIWVDFKTDDFTLIAAKENKLLFSQVFSYASPEDVLYYLLRTAEEFSLSPKEVKLILSGLIEKDSALYKELHAYLLNLEFRIAQWEFTGNNDYPAHFFSSLNDLSLCGS